MQNHKMAVCKRPNDSSKVSPTLFKPSGLLSNHQVSTQSPCSEHRPPQRRRDGKEAGLRHRQANTPAQIQRHRTSGGGGIIFLDQGESFVGCKDIKPFIEPYNPNDDDDSKVDSVRTTAEENINTLLENFMGINDAELGELVLAQDRL